MAPTTYYLADFELAKFILIDHSLRSVGGHHYEYAVHMLREADRAGYENVLVTHRAFRGEAALPQTWRVLPLFHDDVYTNFAVLEANKRRQRRADLKPLAGTSNTPLVSWHPETWLSRFWQFYRCLGFRHRSKRFAGACRALLRSVQLQPGDVVFAATVSGFDMEGLASFLAEYPETKSLNWHLQFHHAFLEGREADDDYQTGMLQAMRRIFQQALAQIPHHRLRFYTTTTQLASQYNRLEVGTFSELPYPVNPKFHQPETPHETKQSIHLEQASRSPAAHPKSSRESRSFEAAHRSRCLNITCAGGMRREKGSHQMAELIRGLWDPYLATGQVRLHIQASRRSFEKVSRQQEQLQGSRNVEPLVRVPHPLGMEDYVRLIRSSDLGLFLYDSHIYYARCSGILAEMLAAGVPVIVPAGCWLADQIAEPIYRYLDGVHHQHAPVRLLGTAEVRWNHLLGENGVCLGPRHTDLQGELHVPKGATRLMVRFRHKAAVDEGHYVRIHFAEHSDRGADVDEQVIVVGQRQHADLPVSAFVALNEAAERVKVSLHDAYGCGGFEITDLQFSFLDASGTPERKLPHAAVGLIASNHDQVPKLLAEIVEHYEHYRRTAEEYAHEWMRLHSPENTFATLLARKAGPLHSRTQAA